MVTRLLTRYYQYVMQLSGKAARRLKYRLRVILISLYWRLD